MLLLLSPAKTLDYDTPVPAALTALATTPAYTARAAELIDHLRTLTPAQVASLMGLSDTLAALSVGRFAAWSRRATARNSRPAAWAFDGAVYGGLSARTLAPADWAWAQQHLVILSGLYGALRPLDRLQPYRLEMGTRLVMPAARNLYEFWGRTLAEYLNARLARERAPVVVNLASQEYFKAVDPPRLQARVIDCVFEDWAGDRYRIASVHAKRARGLMARWVVERRVEQPAGLAAFAAEGYALDAGASTPQRLVFRRRRA